MYLSEHLLNRLGNERTYDLRREAEAERALAAAKLSWRSRLARLLTQLAERLEPGNSRERTYARL